YEVALPIGRANLLPSLSGGLLTAAIGGLLTHLMLKSVDPGQIVGGLILAFAVAAVIGKTVVPQMSAGAAVLAPMAVGIAGSLWVVFNPDLSTAAEIQRAWYRDELPGLAL